ncbi:hypothetical protein NKH18_41110 [Streptomyces sp. M10(2022)]
MLALPLGLAMRSLLATDPLPLPVPVWLPFAAGAAAALIVALAARPVAMLASRGITRLRPAAALGRPAPRAERSRAVAYGRRTPPGPGRGQLGRSGHGAERSGRGPRSLGLRHLADHRRGAARAPGRRGGGPCAGRADAPTGRCLRVPGGQVIGGTHPQAGCGPHPVVLVVAFVCVQLAAASTLERASDRQAAAALRADLVVTGPASGLPAGTARAVRRAPGVVAATGVLRSAVVLERREAGEPVLDRLPVLG